MGKSLTVSTPYKNEILVGVLHGKSEYQICEELGIDMYTIIKTMVEDVDFAERMEQARTIRSEKWVGQIIKLVSHENGTPIIYAKDDVPGVKLAVETFKWLAKVDNPKRYGDKLEMDVTKTNVLELRGLSVEEAVELIKNDPFAPKDGEIIDVEYTERKVVNEEQEAEDEDML